VKNILTIAGATALVAGQSVAATAAPALNSADRAASPVGASEKMGGGNEIWLVLGFAVLAAAIIFLIEENEEDDDFPASP